MRYLTAWLALVVSLSLPAEPAPRERAQVDVFTPPGTVKGVRQVAVRFSEQMVTFGDPRIPEPFDIDCPEKGKGRWADARNWVYDFARDLPAGMKCTFKLKTDITTLGGKSLGGAHEFSFNTGGPAIMASLPSEGDTGIDENQIFVLALDAEARPVSIVQHAHCQVKGISERIGVDVLGGDTRREVLAQRRLMGYQYFRLLWKIGGETTVAVKDEALDRSESQLAVLRCRRTLPPDTEVQLVWGTGIRSLTEVATVQDQALAFKTRPRFTARFECDRVNAESGCLPLHAMHVRFSAPIAAGLASELRLRREDGEAHRPKAIDAAASPVVDTVSFEGPFQERTKFRVLLPPEVKDDAGRPLDNAARFPLEVATGEYPPLAKFSGEFGILEVKEGGILPVTLRNLEAEIAARKFMPGTERTAPIAGRMQRIDQDDGAIGHWIRRVRKVMERRGKWEKTKEDKRVWIEMTGSESVFGPKLETTRFTLPKPGGARAFEVVGIPLREPGFYVVELMSPKLGAALLGRKEPRYVATAALVTNLAVHFKWGREASLVWVTTLDEAQPVPGAAVKIGDYCTGQPIWQGSTGRDGIAMIEGGALPKPHAETDCGPWSQAPLFVSARTGEDMSFTVSGWNRGIRPYEFELPVGWEEGSFVAHAILDRGLYRAGETVSMKHYLRQRTSGGFVIPAADPPDTLKLKHEGSGQEYEIPVVFDTLGIAESTWEIPKDAKLGTYQISLHRKESDKWLNSSSFRVEQFRVPTMRAVIQAPAEPLVNAKEVKVDLFVGYLSGGGASQAPVKLRSQVVAKSLSFPDYSEFAFGGADVKEGIEDHQRDYDYYFGPGSGGAGAKAPAQVLPLTLDNAGAARATIPNLPAIDGPRDIVAELEYQDPNGERLSVSNRIPLWPAKLQLGIRADRWVVVKGTVGLQTVVLDLAGKPVAGRQVAVELFSKTTYSHRRRLVGGFYAYENKTETRRIAGGCEGETDEHGLLSCEVVPEVSGQVVLRSTSRDDLDNQALATREVWIGGAEDWWFEGGAGDRMDLLPERKEYESGETARLQVRMPFRDATALISVEREGVIDSFITTLSGKTPVVEVPIKDHYAPNAYISVLAIRGRAGAGFLADLARRLDLPFGGDDAAVTALVDLGKPAYRLGIASIRVGWGPHRLAVTLKPDAEVHKIRERAKVRITVRRANGQPLPAGAEMAIAAVDEGLLELAPNTTWDLLERMMGTRGLEVYTATAQMQVVGKRHYGRKAVPPGGGGGQQSARELFDTLLLWKGRVALDDRGEAEVKVPLNDSLTSFRIVAVAGGAEGLFGSGHTSVRTSQDLMLHSGLPAIVREGDRFQGMFTVRNASERPIALAASARVSPQPDADAAVDLPEQSLDLEPGQARELRWEAGAPAGAESLVWEVGIQEREGGASDRIRVGQKVIPVYPVRVYQATLTQIEAPLSMRAERPQDAVAGRGGIRVALRGRIGDGLSGVREYMQRYPYTCLEQRISKAIALRDDNLWDTVMNDLPSHQDEDGLLKYFASDGLEGSDVLTAYVLAIAQEAGWPIPDNTLARVKSGLKAFIEGRVIRDSALPTADLAIRKLAAIEALSRYEEASAEMLGSISIDPNLWPTSALIDWMNILKRLSAMPDQAQRVSEADNILRARLNFQGTAMGFSTERTDALWWLMISADVNAGRALLTVLDAAPWKEDVPRMVRGALGRLSEGRWNTTVANAWGVLAMEKFSAAFEAVPVTGATSARFGPETKSIAWTQDIRTGELEFGWGDGPTALAIEHQGGGKPWAIIESRAALSLKEPLSTGYSITRSVTAVDQKRPDAWSRGDVARVSIGIEAQSDMTWVVVDDPIPSGASILGLGRDSQILASGEERQGWAWPAFEERRQDAFRAYYRYVPKGVFKIEYTVRYNNAGVFELPATRVEALYAPEMLGELPNPPVEVKELP
ncbi:MAG: alpha-2-macroglobulin family protein [Gammaproteobacteria bacterium]